MTSQVVRRWRAAAVLVTFLPVGLWSCGGGGGGGGGGGDGAAPPILYEGRTTQAVITQDNAHAFLSLLLGDALETPDVAASSASRVAPLADSGPEASGRSRALPRTPVEGRISGIVSGTASYSGVVEDDGTGIVTFVFTRFNDGDGVTYDGRLILEILAVDPFNLEITHALTTMTPLTVETETDKTTVSGTVESTYDISTLTFIDRLSLDGRDETTAATFRLAELVHTLTCDAPHVLSSCAEEITGRVYLDTEGYVVVSTRAPLQYHYPGRFNVDVPDAGGPLLLAGALQTWAAVTPLSISEVRVELDLDEDPAYELSETYRWHALVGLVITWEETYGTLPNFEVALSAVETRDGGFVAAGWSNTNTANGLDMMLNKTDAAGGPVWTRYLGGPGDDYAQCVRETQGGGLVVAGYTEAPAGARAVVYRLDSAGNPVWSRVFSGDLDNRALAVEPTADGGFILTGTIGSFSPATGVVGFGGDDLYLVKLDQSGNVLWERRFGGSAEDVGYSVIEVSGGGFLAAGSTGSFDPSQVPDVYLVRTDTAGNFLWESHFGGDLPQFGRDVVEDAQGNFVVAGSTATLTSGPRHALFKADREGVLLWSRAYDTLPASSGASSVTLAGDGGYVAAGNSGGFDAQLFKTDTAGNLLWEKTFNWSSFLTMCTADSVERTEDGGFLLAGSAWPGSGKDFYLIKTDANGNL